MQAKTLWVMRPDCNLHLRWDEVTLDAKNLTSWYKLDQHKNVNKGIKAEGAARRGDSSLPLGMTRSDGDR